MRGKYVIKKRKRLKSKKSLSLYSNLTKKHKALKESEHSKNYAAYLADMPKKGKWKRFLYRMNPKNWYKYWFSKHGLFMFLKIVGIAILAIGLLIGILFICFRKDLESISPNEISKRVQTTVTTYLDRDGEVLWEDKGDGDYKLVVSGDEISDYLKKATISIEDKDFYRHGGVSLTGVVRAAVNNVFGGSTQGGSTLTQQLVKQIFFADEASARGLSGIPRKIKEMFLAVEVERMYSKDQILELYLNESPYGGRRNGVESAAQTYFGKSAKDLNIAESALLAAIPQNPTYYNPYNTANNDALIEKQHIVIDHMVEQGYITKAEGEEAKNYAILDTIIPEADQYAGIKAPHFVQLVRSQLIEKLGATAVGNGGLTVKTTLDLDIQNKTQEAMDDMFSSSVPAYAGFTNGAATVEDSQTGQIVALVGSRDFNYAGFGQDNAATAYIQPGSSIKPLVYSELFEDKGSNTQNYGSGSILKDENIDSIYGAQLQNADRKFAGSITIRRALATSRNIPAVKAMYISGISNTLDTIHNMGAASYCTQGSETSVGLAAAIGGCGVKQVDLVNAYATLARGGVYKEQTTILEVTNNSGESLIKYSESAGKQIIDAQSAYIVSDILHDDNARASLSGYHAKGMYISGVDTATKTGTSDIGGNAKDIWMFSYSPALTMGVWLGNSNTTTLKNGTSSIPGPIIDKVISYAHKTVYAESGKWKSGDWFSQPSGIQSVGGELYPSWWNKKNGQSETTLTFDKVSKKKATEYTPDGAKIELTVTKVTDAVTKKDSYTAPDGYDGNADDDVHLAGDAKPSVSVSVTDNHDNSYTITVSVGAGKFTPTSIDISAGGTGITSLGINGGGTYTHTVTLTSADTSAKTVSATVTDSGYYTGTGSSSASTPIYK